MSISIVREISKTRLTRRRALYPRFVLGADDNGLELSIDATSLLDKKNSGTTIPFSSVKMQWGYRELGLWDVLISSCEKGAYYVATHVWDVYYKLDNGKQFTLSQDICKDKKEGAKTIQMNFYKRNVEESVEEKKDRKQVDKLKVTLNNCHFKWDNGMHVGTSNQKILTMNCKGDTNVTGNKVQEENVFLTLTDNDYKLEYNPTKSNRS